MLEFCALVDRRKGRSALQAYRPSLELLRLSMKDGNLPHYGLLQSICDTLPGVSPQTQGEVQKMAGKKRGFLRPSRRDCWPEWLR